jgi:lysozyme
MWQYTDGALGGEPHTVAGIGRCDRDTFNGSVAQLRRLWAG